MAYERADLYVIDISDPTNPYEVGSYRILWSAQGVHVVGSYAYLAADAFQVLDVSDPTDPYQVGSYYTYGLHIDGVHVVGDYAYVNSHGAHAFQVLDISDPTNPYQVGSYDQDYLTTNGVYAVGDYAYLVSDSKRLFIFRYTGSLPPIADADGPYTGNEGSPITFDASDSYDPDGTIVSYEWDLDGDGQYDDATGVSP